MHLLEDYHQLQVTKREVEVNLKAEIESHNADTEEFRRAVTFWSSESAADLVDDTAMVPTLFAGKEGTKGLAELGSYAEFVQLLKNDHSRPGKTRSIEQGKTVKARFKGKSTNPTFTIMLMTFSFEAPQTHFAITPAKYTEKP